MMATDWQTVASLACVGLAMLVVVRRAIRMFVKPEAGCHTGGCVSCPSRGAASSTNSAFVPLETLISSSRSTRTEQATDKQ